MREMVGVLLFAQESRFQVIDLDGVGHGFVLSHAAAAEPAQLAGLGGMRVRVRYREAAGLLALAAVRVDVMEGQGWRS